MEEEARKESSARHLGQSEATLSEIRQSACHQQVRADNEVVHELRQYAFCNHRARAHVRLPALRA